MDELKQRENLAAEVRNFAGAGTSAMEGALLVSSIINPATDVAWCRRRITELAALLPQAAEATDITVMLSAQGFRGSEAYYKSSNSALQTVLETGEGIPISLAMVVLGVCETAEVAAHGVNFPGHFLVSIADRLVDPFTMEVLDEVALQRLLQTRRLDYAEAMQVATPAGIVIRMLNNLSAIATANNDASRALELSDYKLLLAEDALPIYLERVDLWQMLGVAEMARRDLSAAIALLPEGPGRVELEERLAAMADTVSRLH